MARMSLPPGLSGFSLAVPVVREAAVCRIQLVQTALGAGPQRARAVNVNTKDDIVSQARRL